MQKLLNGMAIDEVAIELLREIEPPQGFIVAYSGGKDSEVIWDLAKRAGVKHEARYHVTTVDPPELVAHVRSHPEVIMERPKRSLIWHAGRKGIMPTRWRAWCCDKLKHNAYRDPLHRAVIVGVRAEESNKRAGRNVVEYCAPHKCNVVNLIYTWTSADVWQYIRDRGIRYCPLYDTGLTRLGCVACPKNIGGQRVAAERWPKQARIWKAAAAAVHHRMGAGLKAYHLTGDELYENWLDGLHLEADPGAQRIWDTEEDDDV